MPPTAVVGDDREIAMWPPAGDAWACWRVVTKTGEMMTVGLHAARRHEAGAETLLRARNELAAVDGGTEGSGRRGGKRPGRRRDWPPQLRARPRACHRRLEEELREAERASSPVKNEADLHARRLEEAKSQVGRTARPGRAGERVGQQMEADLAEAESMIVAKEAELEEARAALRAVQGRLESLRRDVTRLEEKKGQAALVEVRLQERCRAQESERQRRVSPAAGRGRRRGAVRAPDGTRGRYAPALVALLAVVERLAEMSRRMVAETWIAGWRKRGRDRERCQSHARLGQAPKPICSANWTRPRHGHTQLQVDKARLDDRRVLLEDELADLRRKHMAPRA